MVNYNRHAVTAMYTYIDLQPDITMYGVCVLCLTTDACTVDNCQDALSNCQKRRHL